jgi:hypothetical protein
VLALDERWSVGQEQLLTLSVHREVAADHRAGAHSIRSTAYHSSCYLVATRHQLLSNSGRLLLLEQDFRAMNVGRWVSCGVLLVSIIACSGDDSSAGERTCDALGKSSRPGELPTESLERLNSVWDDGGKDAEPEIKAALADLMDAMAAGIQRGGFSATENFVIAGHLVQACEKYGYI